jgi:hypothetical protein
MVRIFKHISHVSFCLTDILYVRLFIEAYLSFVSKDLESYYNIIL